MLTGVPVLCFALATPFMAVLLGRLGTGRVVAASLVTVLAGTLLRSADGFGTALVGTVLIGVAITAGNVAVPVVIGRDFPGHVPRVTGLYTAALNGGSVLTTTLTAPLADVVGWRWALASWGLLAVVALVVWQRAYPFGRPEPVVVVATTGAPDVWRRPVTWFLAVAFAGQAFGYYAVSAWLPSLLHDTLGLERAASGGAAALFQLFGMVGGIAVPIALGSARARRRRVRGDRPRVGGAAGRPAARALVVARVVHVRRGGAGRQLRGDLHRHRLAAPGRRRPRGACPRPCRASATAAPPWARACWARCTRPAAGGRRRCSSCSARCWPWGPRRGSACAACAGST